MRKVLSFVLVLALVLGSFSMAFASYSDMAGESSSEAVDVLSGLGVISGYPDGTFKPGNIVTRAEMAKLIVAALGLEDYATATTSKYPDMTAAPWAQGFVAYGTSLGFISGYPDGTFKPNQTVSYEEACSMILRALGYTSEFLPGEWPAEWVIKAKTLGILDDISAGMASGATRGNIAEMLYNSLELGIGYVDKDGVWQEYANDSMLVRLGATYIAADDAAALTGAGFAADGIIYGDEDTEINLRAYVGVYADRYVDSGDDIIKVVPVSVAMTGDFDSASISSGKLTPGGVFTDDADDAEYDLRTIGTPVFFDNGVYDATPANVTTSAMYTVNVDLSGMKIDKFYSVALWTVNDAFMFEDGDLEAKELYGHPFTLDDNDKIDTDSFELLGADSLADIDEDNVVYIYKNVNITKVEVGTDVVSGEVTKISSSGKVTVNGVEYELASAPGADTTDWNNIDLEDEVEFALDYSGDVYKVTITSAASADNYAIILVTEDSSADENPITGADAQVKLFLADGTAKVFTVDADEVTTVSGLMSTTAGTWNANLAGTLVEYGLNSDGEVDAISSMAPLTTASGIVSTSGYFAGKAILSDVVVFTYDGTTSAHVSNADYYDVTTLANIKGNEYDEIGFNYDTTDKVIDVMVILGEGTGGDNVYGVITSWFMSVSSSTDYMVTVMGTDGVKVDYAVVKTIYANLAPANKYPLYEVTFNSNNEVTSFPAIGADVAGSDDDADLVKEGTIITAYALGVVGFSDGDKAIDSDAVAYDWVDGEYVSATISKSNLAAGDKVKLYDFDEDGVADFVLINSNF